jgi:hypothetical protein
MTPRRDVVEKLFHALVTRDPEAREDVDAIEDITLEEWEEAAALTLAARDASADYDEKRLAVMVFFAQRQGGPDETFGEIQQRLSIDELAELAAIVGSDEADDEGTVTTP